MFSLIIGLHLGRHLGYIEMLNDARVASLGFFKDNVCTTRINKEKKFKIKFQVLLKYAQILPDYICSLQNSSYCLLSTISGIFTINALLQQPCVPFHFDKQASFATSTPTNVCLQNHKCFLRQVKDFMV